jgi:hypothetical protein
MHLDKSSSSSNSAATHYHLSALKKHTAARGSSSNSADVGTAMSLDVYPTLATTTAAPVVATAAKHVMLGK